MKTAEEWAAELVGQSDSPTQVAMRRLMAEGITKACAAQAAEIEALVGAQAEIERLKAERDELAKYADACSEASGIYYAWDHGWQRGPLETVVEAIEAGNLKADVAAELGAARDEIDELRARCLAYNEKEHDALRLELDLKSEIAVLKSECESGGRELGEALDQVNALRARAEQAERERDAHWRATQECMAANRDLVAERDAALERERELREALGEWCYACRCDGTHDANCEYLNATLCKESRALLARSTPSRSTPESGTEVES